MEHLPKLVTGRIYLFSGENTYAVMQTLAVHVAATEHVQCLIGGNRFDINTISRQLYRKTFDLEAALARIHLSRAFNCAQIVSMLREAKLGLPTLALDLLAPYSEENINAADAGRLVRRCIFYLERLASHAPVAVSAAAPQGREELLDLLAEHSHQRFIMRAPKPDPTRQLRMFP